MEFQWFQIFVPLAAGAIGFFGNMIFENRKQLKNKATEERRKIYSTFSDIMIDRLRSQETITEEQLEKINDRMFNFYKDYLLYASPDVINAIGDLQQFTFTLQQRLLNGETIEEIDRESSALYLKYSQVIYEMREDLGFSIKNLGANGEHVLKSFLSNYYMLYPKKTTNFE